MFYFAFAVSGYILTETGCVEPDKYINTTVAYALALFLETFQWLISWFVAFRPTITRQMVSMCFIMYICFISLVLLLRLFYLNYRSLQWHVITGSPTHVPLAILDIVQKYHFRKASIAQLLIFRHMIQV